MRRMCEMRKNSKNALRIGRMERIVANVNATSPTAPHCIQSCVKSNIAGSLIVAIFEFPGQWGVWPMNVLPVHYTADSVQPEKNETCTGRRSMQYIQLSRQYSYSTVEIKTISNTLPFHEKRPLNLSRTWFRLCGKEVYWDWQDIMLFLPANATIRGNWQDAKWAALSSKNHELRPWAMSSGQLKSKT